MPTQPGLTATSEAATAETSLTTPSTAETIRAEATTAKGTTAKATTAPGEATPDPRRWRALPVILIASFMSLFDVFVVNVAAPSIETDLGASNAGLELIVGGYSFTYAAGLVTAGRLGDRFGRRRMYLIGMAVFTVASALCGLAPNEATLIGGRLLQGAGAAGMVPQVLALLTVTFPPAERARAFAFFGVTIGLGGVCGQVLGGVLLDLDIFGLGWRPIFLVNVPIGLAALVGARRLVAESRAARPEGLDPVGLGTLMLGIGLVLVPLTLGRDEGWPLWTWLALGTGLAVLVGFASWEARLARGGGHPIIPPAVVRSRPVVGGMVMSAGYFLFFGGFLLSLTIFLQVGQHRSPLNAGLMFAPLGAVFALSSLWARRLAGRYGPRVLTAGSLATMAALGGLAAVVAAEGTGVSAYELTPLLMLIGVGNGLVIPALAATVMAAAPPDISGTVSGVLTTTQQFASALGVSGGGALFFAESSRHGPDAGLLATVLVGLVSVGVALAGSLILPGGFRPAGPAGRAGRAGPSAPGAARTAPPPGTRG
ncbi:drug resistance transporter, EmrB/QacA subfamily [Frankia sp. EI5c]|uniref:MFS transporter n=1 Tax=Frankia sp. EI5c TaxID=683316 RepID=UPI0007C3A8E3|nr:MFS transporter [Frankia sp. EI5c]OAA29579.1 drug resistance transporter, EmrB/QacA subfamily [Frankia sp. EI5c]